MRTTRVLVVEDERLMGELLSEVIAEEPDMLVAGVARSLAELRHFSGAAPDVILMDYRLPDGTGAEATRIARSRWRSARVVMLSALHDDEVVLESIQAGADGFLSKDRAAGEIVATIRRAKGGEMMLPPEVVTEIARRVAANQRAAPVARLEPLTPREREIVRALADGLSTREIAARFDITEHTLRTHVQHILAKLGAHSKLEAVMIALRNGIVAGPDPRG